MPGYHTTGTVIIYALFVALAGYVIWVASDLPSGGGIMPIFAASGVIMLSLVRILRDVRAALAADTLGFMLNEELDGASSFDARVFRMLAVLVLSALYVYAIFLLGYFAATAVFICVGAVVLGVRDWKSITITVLVLLPAMYAFFIMFLGANLPKGMLI